MSCIERISNEFFFFFEAGEQLCTNQLGDEGYGLIGKPLMRVSLWPCGPGKMFV